jgi:small subunit ribosomal protein S18
MKTIKTMQPKKRGYSSYRRKFKPKEDYFTKHKVTEIDYRNVDFLKMFIHNNNRILPSKKTGTKQRFQRKISLSIKRARYMALLPYC